jgi:hypothetical protein
MYTYQKILKIKDAGKKEEKAIKLYQWIAKKNYTTKRSFKDNIYMRYNEKVWSIPYFNNLFIRLFNEGYHTELEKDLKKYNK